MNLGAWAEDDGHGNYAEGDGRGNIYRENADGSSKRTYAKGFPTEEDKYFWANVRGDGKENIRFMQGTVQLLI